ncbi:MAG: hypothetical protein Q9169_006481 [Polycauliona sp. 2 TL-2023]
MPPTKRKRQKNRTSSDDSDAQHRSGGVNSSGYGSKAEHSAPRKQVIDAPFSIDMFQRLSKHPYDDEELPKLNTMVCIRPEAIWASLRNYNNFTIRNHKLAIHHYALASRFQPLPKSRNPCDIDDEIICPARILEIRAKDARNVYIRLYWLYTPDQLPGGRRPYHGKDELIVTNHMEIVDASRVIAPTTVVDLRGKEGKAPYPATHPDPTVSATNPSVLTTPWFIARTRNVLSFYMANASRTPGSETSVSRIRSSSRFQFQFHVPWASTVQNQAHAKAEPQSMITRSKLS